MNKKDDERNTRNLKPRQRRYWPDSKKLEIVEESFFSNESASKIARRHGITPAQLFKWRFMLKR
nr:transposase [Acidisoma cellulosilyticum]